MGSVSIQHSYPHTPENPRTVMIYTDSRVALDSLHNPNNYAYLVEEIRKKLLHMARAK
jgi:hypothetical protein